MVTGCLIGGVCCRRAEDLTLQYRDRSRKILPPCDPTFSIGLITTFGPMIFWPFANDQREINMMAAFQAECLYELLSNLALGIDRNYM